MRYTLEAALVLCADGSLKNTAGRFLAGLSCDELQFIAEFLGACILESSEKWRPPHAGLAWCIAEFQQARATPVRVRTDDLEHKMILLHEYLCRSGLQEYSVPIG